MAIYKSKDSLRGVTLSFGDTIQFTKTIQYSVTDRYLSNDDGNNQKIFEHIGYGGEKRFGIASGAYGYKDGGGDCPTCKSGDYAALTRLAYQIFERIEVLDDFRSDEPYELRIPKNITLKLNGGKSFVAEFDKTYQVKTTGSQCYNGVIVTQDYKILMLSNNPNWNGGHKLSEKNAAYGFKFQWHFGSVHDLVPGKEFYYGDMHDIVPLNEPEPTTEERIKASIKEYEKYKLEELREADPEEYIEVISTAVPGRKAKLVFKKIR